MIKLVRDKIPEIMDKERFKYDKVAVTSEELNHYLYSKLLEESMEAARALLTPVAKNEIIEEIADVLEVSRAILNYHNIDYFDVVDRMKEKRDKKGSFDKGTVISF